MVTWFTEFSYFVKIGCWLRLKDPVGIFLSLPNSMTCTNGSLQDDNRVSEKPLKKVIIAIGTQNDHILNEGVTKIFEFTFSALPF